VITLLLIAGATLTVFRFFPSEISVTIDIRTVILITCISHLMQLLVFAHQYWANSDIKGPGWWLLWSGSVAFGFNLILLRSVPGLLPFVIVLQDGVILAGILFVYVGVLKFLDRKVPWGALAFFLGSFLVIHNASYFLVDSMVVRSITMEVYLAILGFWTAVSLLRNATKSISSTARFNAGLFIVHGSIFAFMAAYHILSPGESITDHLASTGPHLLEYCEAPVMGLLWTFGLIIMLNQKLHAEKDEARQHFETIYNASPDGAIIIRVSDRQFVDCNEGFLHQSGYSKEEILGRNALEMELWEDRERITQLMNILNTTGSCDNFEATFRRKDGTLMTGLTTVRSVTLHDAPHIISVTRDINDRKKAEAEREALIAELRKALDQIKTLKGIVPICANCKKIRDDKGFWEGVEAYVARHTEAKFTHGICPECREKLYPESLITRKAGPGPGR
jgi:PAS domain S-box-containing protein